MRILFARPCRVSGGRTVAAGAYADGIIARVVIIRKIEVRVRDRYDGLLRRRVDRNFISGGSFDLLPREPAAIYADGRRGKLGGVLFLFHPLRIERHAVFRNDVLHVVALCEDIPPARLPLAVPPAVEHISLAFGHKVDESVLRHHRHVLSARIVEHKRHFPFNESINRIHGERRGYVRKIRHVPHSRVALLFGHCRDVIGRDRTAIIDFYFLNNYRIRNKSHRHFLRLPMRRKRDVLTHAGTEVVFAVAQIPPRKDIPGAVGIFRLFQYAAAAHLHRVHRTSALRVKSDSKESTPVRRAFSVVAGGEETDREHEAHQQGNDDRHSLFHTLPPIVRVSLGRRLRASARELNALNADAKRAATARKTTLFSQS